MENLKELRKTKQLYLKDVAKHFNVAISTYSQWENSVCEPDIDTMVKLADFFNCTVDYLVGRESEDGTVFILGNELSKDETQLIDMIRQLHNDDKDIIYKLVESILLSYKSKK